ncbi:MAG: DMT family transporter [Pseudomonadota bacterium]
MSAPHARRDDVLRGIALMVLAYLNFTAIDTCAKWLVLSGIPTMQVGFVRYGVHTLLVVALFLPALGRSLVHTRRPGLEAARAGFLLASTVFNFFAVQYLPLTLTATIVFTTPLWICMLSVVLLGERVGPRRWAAIAVGFAGVAIAARPWSAEAHWAILLSLGMAISAAFYIILTRRLAGVDSTATQQFYAALLATLAVAPFLGEWVWPVAALDWTALALIGVVGWSGHQLLTVAHRFAPASTLAPFIYVQMLFMVGSSWLVFAEPPDAWVLSGGAVVLASGLYLWHRERQLALTPTTTSGPA